MAGFCNPARCERVYRNGVCMRTGRRHQVLAGVDPVSKLFWTHVAEAYPRGLARSLAKMLHDARQGLLFDAQRKRLQF